MYSEWAGSKVSLIKPKKPPVEPDREARYSFDQTPEVICRENEEMTLSVSLYANAYAQGRLIFFEMRRGEL